MSSALLAAFRDRGEGDGAEDLSRSIHIRMDSQKVLGRGAWGTVYVGLNEATRELYAVKEVRFGTEQQVQAAVSEIRVMKRLDHPNIVKYFGAERSERTLRIFMEYVPGGSLAALIRNFGPLTETMAQGYSVDVVEGLAYLHGKNIAHRDIKCDNILVQTNGSVKLADFGQSKEGGAMRTVTGTVCFMAPEVMHGETYSLMADIWSYGCTVIEMLAGRPPFSHFPNQNAIMFHIDKVDPLKEIPVECSARARDHLTRCLQRNPSDRLTALQLLEHPFLAEYRAKKARDLANLERGRSPPDTQTSLQSTSSSSSIGQQQQPPVIRQRFRAVVPTRLAPLRSSSVIPTGGRQSRSADTSSFAKAKRSISSPREPFGSSALFAQAGVPLPSHSKLPRENSSELHIDSFVAPETIRRPASCPDPDTSTKDKGPLSPMCQPITNAIGGAASSHSHNAFPSPSSSASPASSSNAASKVTTPNTPYSNQNEFPRGLNTLRPRHTPPLAPSKMRLPDGPLVPQYNQFSRPPELAPLAPIGCLSPTFHHGLPSSPSPSVPKYTDAEKETLNILNNMHSRAMALHPSPSNKTPLGSSPRPLQRTPSGSGSGPGSSSKIARRLMDAGMPCPAPLTGPLSPDTGPSHTSQPSPPQMEL